VPTITITAAPTEVAATGDRLAMTWVSRELVDLEGPRVGEFSRVAAMGGRVVAIANAGLDTTALFVSSDGRAWDHVEAIPAELDLETLAVIGGRFWVSGHRGPKADPIRQVWTSGNGRAWRREQVKGLQFGRGRLDRVAHVGGVWLASAWSDEEHFGVPLLFRSVDGRVWIRVEPDVEDVRTLAWTLVGGGSGFVALQALEAQDGSPIATAVHSDDGLTWTASRITAAPADLKAVAWGEEGYVAVGSKRTDGSGTLPAVYASSDGTRWTEGTVESPPSGASDAMLHAVPFRDGFVASGYVNDEALTVWASLDGHSWFVDPAFPPKFGWIFTIAATDSRVVMAGQNENGGDFLAPQVWIGELVPP
jgi:hypothetical protein